MTTKRYSKKWRKKVSDSVKRYWRNKNYQISDETRKKLSNAAKKGNSQRNYKRKPVEELISPVAIRQRIFEERGRKCERCGWAEMNPHVNIIPVQLDHIDGNRKNNSKKNLIVLCPNHHSLTKHFMFYGRSHEGTYGKKGTVRYR